MWGFHGVTTALHQILSPHCCVESSKNDTPHLIIIWLHRQDPLYADINIRNWVEIYL